MRPPSFYSEFLIIKRYTGKFPGFSSRMFQKRGQFYNSSLYIYEFEANSLKSVAPTLTEQAYTNTTYTYITFIGRIEKP